MLRLKTTSLMMLLICSGAVAQSHFTDCTSLTGNNATILIPSTASLTLDGDRLPGLSEIAVYTPDGLCAGVVVWQDESIGFSVWGDDTQTADKDGFATGELLTYRVWDADADKEYAAASANVTFSDTQPFYITENAYVENGIYELSTFSIETENVSTEASDLPDAFRLYSNYPNPFNPTTSIRFDLPRPTHVRIAVYNAAGAQVDNVLNESRPAGAHTLQWDAGNMPTGTYFYRVEAGEQVEIQSMVLLR